MSKIDVSKISLKIGKRKQIDLSLDEARELQRILADLLGIEKCNRITVTPPVVIPYPYPAPAPRRYEWWEVKPIWVGGDSSNIGATHTSGYVVSNLQIQTTN